MLKRYEVEILLKTGVWRDFHRRSSNVAGVVFPSHLVRRGQPVRSPACR
jgi:hypothetical protein